MKRRKAPNTELRPQRPDIEALHKVRPYRIETWEPYDLQFGFVEISESLRDQVIDYIYFLESHVAPEILRSDALTAVQRAAMDAEVETHLPPKDIKHPPQKRAPLELWQVSAETLSEMLSQKGFAAETRTITNWRMDSAYQAAVRHGINERYAAEISRRIDDKE